MSRQLITAVLVMSASAAYAQPVSDPAPASPAPTAYAPPPHIPAVAPSPAEPAEPPDHDIGDQAISAQLGLATGARATPGGLRIAGHYLYQLAEHDWFDGIASFTFGSSRAACFRDRSDRVVCSHGLADGAGVEVVGGVRRMFAPQGAFRPYARVGVGLGLARFADDSVSGFTINAHGGGGVRVKVAPSIAVVGEADLALGLGSFNRGVGSEPQVSLAVTAGVEFRLR